MNLKENCNHLCLLLGLIVVASINLHAQQRNVIINDIYQSDCKNSSEMENFAFESKMVVEGRTWWYDANWYGPIEYGIRIGSKALIDGIEWNKVYVCLHHKDVSDSKPYDTTYEWINYNEDEGLVAYIREENDKIFAKIADYHFSKELKPCALMDNSPLFWNSGSSALIYDFSNNETFTLGSEEIDSPELNFSIIDNDIVESCGYSYKRFKCSADESNYLLSNNVYFTQGIGVTGEWSDDNKNTYYSLFYAPFYMAATNGMNLVSLKYVTDKEDNIIYQGTGGTKLWEQYQDVAVQNIINDNQNDKIEYFNLQGIKIDTPAPGSIVIMLKNNRYIKVWSK